MISVDITNLPEDVTALKSIIEQYHSHNKILEEKITLLTARLFGRRSEKLTAADQLQGRLFDEADAHADDVDTGEKNETVKVKAYNRTKRGRKPIPENLPREIIEHDISDQEKKCACGKEKTRIGSDESERLDIIPAQIKVIKHVYYKYACSNCEGVTDEGEEKAVVTAPREPQMIPRSIATSGLIAYMLTAKFCDALPFYRQEKMFARIGVELSRATMCNIAMLTVRRSQRFLELMMEELLKSRFLGIDETTVQVMDEPGRKNTTKSFMWVFRGGSRDHPIVVFRYTPTRSAKAALPYLESYDGIIQSDGYKVYDVISRQEKLIHAGCMAHARRRFIDALKAGPSGTAQSIVDFIRQLYKIEDEIRDKNLSDNEIQEVRQKQSLPILEKIKERLDRDVHHVAPGSGLGKAIGYMLEQWPKLLVYLNYGFLPIDNNLVENAIRPFVIGRKNWLFSGSPRGASASAAIYSIIETAKSNGHEPYWYLRYLFEKLPAAKNDDELRGLLPYSIDPASVPRS
jgi:transposase